MKGIETGKDKVKKICDVLRRETLDPALKEAEEVVLSAREMAKGIIAAAQAEAQELKEAASKERERQKNILHSSLSQACKQAVEALKQNIEEKLFTQNLARLITKQTQDPRILSDLITAVIKAIDKGGVDVVLSAYIPAVVPARSVNTLLAHEFLERLKEKSVLVGSLTGGIQIKLHKENMTLDLSDQALQALVAEYIRKDFREMLFG